MPNVIVTVDPPIVVQVKGQSPTTAVVSQTSVGGTTRLVELADVDASGAQDGYVLVWSTAANKFVFQAINGAFAQANGAFNKANAAVANSGVTVNGSILIGNTVSGGFDLNTLVQGSGMTITNGKGTIAISATPVASQVLINFLGTANIETTFTITDARVTTSNVITGAMAYTAAPGRDLDECDMDSFNLQFGAGAGVITVYVKPLEGFVAGAYYLNYHVS